MHSLAPRASLKSDGPPLTSKPTSRNCLRSSSFDSEGSVGSSVRRTDDRQYQWRKFGIRYRQEKLRADEEARGTLLMNQCVPIERYYEISERILDQIMQSLKEQPEEWEELYLSANRLMRFLSTSLPTHVEFHSKDPFLSKLRIKSRNDLSQLGVLVEEAALKIDRNIYEECLWGNLPDTSDGFHTVEPTLHPLILDDDHSLRRSCKKVTFCTEEIFNQVKEEDANNSFSSESTSTTDVSSNSMSSPELLKSDEQVFTRDQDSLIDCNQAFKLPTDFFRSGSSFKMASNINWYAESRSTQDKDPLKPRKNYENVNETFRVQVQGKKEKDKSLDLMESSLKENLCGTLVDEEPVLKKVTTFDSCEDDDLDHANYVKNLTLLEFTQKQSPPRVITSKYVAKDKIGPNFIQQDYSLRNVEEANYLKDSPEETKGSVFSSTNIHNDVVDISNVASFASRLADASHDSERMTAFIKKEVVRPHRVFSDSSFSSNDDEDGISDSTVLGIARRDEVSAYNEMSHVEHIQYLQDRLLSDEPEANERAWGKTWLRRSTFSDQPLIDTLPDEQRMDDPTQKNQKSPTVSSCQYPFKYTSWNGSISKPLMNALGTNECLSHRRMSGLSNNNARDCNAPDDELMDYK